MKLIAIASALILAGCAAPTPARVEAAKTAYHQIEADLADAQNNARTTCTGPAQCDKAYALAKVYVQQYSDMKVQFSDNVSIFTYSPNKPGLIGMRATRIPGAGASETITLSVSCNGLPVPFLEHCASRVIPRYRGFVPYVTSQY